MSPGLQVGDWVETPHGTARIVEIRTNLGEWVFGRYRLRPLVIVEQQGGKRHAWVPAKVKPLQ